MINPLSELLAIIHRDGGHYEAQHGTEKAVQDAMNKIHGMRAAMQEFCDRVESGEVRSTYTYNKFKQLLESM